MPKFSWILLARIAFAECFLHSCLQLLTKKGRFPKLGLIRKCQGWLEMLFQLQRSLAFQLITCKRTSKREEHFIHLHFDRDIKGKGTDNIRHPGSIITQIQVSNPFSCLFSLPVSPSPLLFSSTGFSLSVFQMLSFLHNIIKNTVFFSSLHLCS